MPNTNIEGSGAEATTTRSKDAPTRTRFAVDRTSEEKPRRARANAVDFGKRTGGGKKRYIKTPKGKRLVRTGSRGGKYYIYKGKKVYLKNNCK